MVLAEGGQGHIAHNQGLAIGQRAGRQGGLEKTPLAVLGGLRKQVGKAALHGIEIGGAGIKVNLSLHVVVDDSQLIDAVDVVGVGVCQ